MISTPLKTRKLIALTAGNIRNNHIPVTGLRDLLPTDCLGSAKKRDGKGKSVIIYLEGLDRTIETDIGRDAKTGRPRNHFRERAWIRRFFGHHCVKTGDILEFERLSERKFRMSVVNNMLSSSTAPVAMRTAEFFAGIGLVRMALESCGMSVVFANDIDPDKYNLYAANFPTKDFRLCDIHALKASDLPECELITASFPCTDLSIAGAMNGINHGESSAFWALIRLLEEMPARRPPLIMLENVPGLLMSRNGKDFAAVLSSLNMLGYACDALLVDASRFTPQSRLRLFIIAKLGREGKFPFGLQESSARPKHLVSFITSHPEIRWDIRALPELPELQESLTDVLEDLPDDDPAWWSVERAEYFFNQLSERHAAIAKSMMAGENISFGTAFRRVRHGRSMAELRTDGLAGCLRTPRGGSGRQILFKAGKGRYQVRLLTARECARLQGVPDSYVINVPLNKALFGFGDAVCVPAVKWIVENYLLPEGSQLMKDKHPQSVLVEHRS